MQDLRKVAHSVTVMWPQVLLNLFASSEETELMEGSEDGISYTGGEKKIRICDSQQNKLESVTD